MEYTDYLTAAVPVQIITKDSNNIVVLLEGEVGADITSGRIITYDKDFEPVRFLDTNGEFTHYYPNGGPIWYSGKVDQDMKCIGEWVWFDHTLKGNNKIRAMGPLSGPYKNGIWYYRHDDLVKEYHRFSVTAPYITKL